MNKEQIVEKLKHNPIAEGKKEPVSNSDGDNYKDLMSYKAILDNVRFGAHTKRVFQVEGIELELRLLTWEESNNIKKEVIAEAKKDGIFDDFNLTFLEVTKTVAKALTPSPYKTKGSDILNEHDVRQFSQVVLEGLYRDYIEFHKMAIRRPAEMTDDEITHYVNVIKKKPEAAKELDWPKLLTVILYLVNYSKNLEEMLKPDLSN